MFKLTNARGETVDINTPSLRSYTPTGLGLQITNSYSPYETYFIPTKSVLSQGIMQVYMKFGDIESQSYQSFSDFAEFLAYQPYTLEYDFDDNTYYRDARLQSLTKTEIGGSTIDAFDRLNEIFTLEFINNWYNNKTAEYKSYDPDPNLGTYGKIYRPKYDPYVNRNLLTAANDHVSIPADSTNNYNFRVVYSNLLPGVMYTFSANVVSNSSVVHIGAFDAPIGKEFQGIDAIVADGRIAFTFTIPNTETFPGNFLIYSGIGGGTIGKSATYTNMKIAIGTDSNWSPAPEDNPIIPFGYAYAPYYVYQESNRPSNEKVMSLNNKSQYFGLQSGSPSIITVKGPCSVNPTWTVVQNGNVVATDGFVLTLTDNQKLVVSSYPEDQYARLYNPDGSYVDVSQLQDYTKTNFVQIPEGESTVLFYLDTDSDVNITFKEERLLV